MNCDNAVDGANNDISAPSSTLVQMREGSGGNRSALRRGSTTGHIDGHLGKNGGNIYFDVGKAPPSDQGSGAILPPLTAIPAPGKPVSLHGSAQPGAATASSMPSLSRSGGSGDHPSVDEVAP